jgi:cellobiose epimerase
MQLNIISDSSRTFLSELLGALKEKLLPSLMHGLFYTIEQAPKAVENNLGSLPGSFGNFKENAMLLYVFSSAYRHFFSSRYLHFAKTYYYHVSFSLNNNNPDLNTKKKLFPDIEISAYAIALFAILEFYLATDSEEALFKAMDLYALMEKYGYDNAKSGYFNYLNVSQFNEESFNSEKEKHFSDKSLLAHINIIESYSQLYLIYKDNSLRQQIESIIDLILNRMYDKEHDVFNETFDKNWSTLAGKPDPLYTIVAALKIFYASFCINKSQYKSNAVDFLKLCCDRSIQKHPDTEYYLKNMQGMHELQAGLQHTASASLQAYWNVYRLSNEKKYLDKALTIWSFYKSKALTIKALQDVESSIENQASFFNGNFSTTEVQFYYMQTINKIVMAPIDFFGNTGY